MENQDKVLQSVIEGIKYQPIRDVLIKPLDPIMVEKEIVEQIPNGKKDKEGYNLYDVKKTKKKVESEFREGIILIMPSDVPCDIFKPGDKVVYPARAAKEFDLFKTSVLVKTYDIIATINK